MRFTRHILPNGQPSAIYWISECERYGIMEFDYFSEGGMYRKLRWFGVYVKRTGESLARPGTITTIDEAIAVAEAHKKEQEGET